MFVFLLVIHVLVALFLIGVILIQGGRGGLGEALGGAAAQSLFGGGANLVMARVTTAAAALFMVTCLSLAAISTARGRSVIEQLPASVDQLPLTLPGEPVQPTAPPAVPTSVGEAETAPSQPAQPTPP